MLFHKAKPEPTSIENALENAISELAGHDPDSQEYAQILVQVKELHEMKLAEKKQPRVDPNTWVTVGGSLAGIIAMLSYERLHVVTTKAMQLLIKPRA